MSYIIKIIMLSFSLWSEEQGLDIEDLGGGWDIEGCF